LPEFLRQVNVFSHKRLTACLGFAVLALLAFVAPPAMAESCNAPPGTSGIVQYCESIPSPAGAGGGGKHSGGGGSDTHKLSPATTKKLQQSGDAGDTVLALTKSSPLVSSDTAAPAKQKLATRHHKTRHEQSSSTQSTTPTQTPAVSRDTTPAAKTSFGVGDSLSGSLGAGFLVLLIVIAGLFGFLAWLSRRDRREPQLD
jgi:hypothetical protein